MMFEWYMKTVGKDQPLHRALHMGILDYVEEELCIVVPFISLKAVTDMVSRLQKRLRRRSDPIRIRFIAAGDTDAYLLGEGELVAIKYLISGVPREHNLTVEVRTVTMLHAKVYIASGKRALVASANLTVKGMRKNKEAGILTCEPDILERIQVHFDKLWAAATPVNLGQIQNAIQEVDRWRREHADGIRLLESRSKPVLFRPVPPSQDEYESISQVADSFMQHQEKATPDLNPKIQTEISRWKAISDPGSGRPTVNMEQSRGDQIKIHQRGRHRLALQLLSLAGGRWRIEIHRRGRPRGLAWESYVEPNGRLSLSLVEQWLLVELFGQVSQVDLDSLAPMRPPSVIIDTWDLIVHWTEDGVLVPKDSNTTVSGDGEGLYID